MSQTLNTALEQVKMARVQVFPRSVRKQINLFEDDMSSEITFNGYNNPVSYQHHLESFYNACKQEIGQEINLRLNQLDELKRQFDLAKYEVREFRLWYFPKNDLDTLFHRVEFVQHRHLESLEQLYQHRITHLERFFASYKPSSYHLLPTKHELHDQQTGQLSLFPPGSPNTLLQWQKEKVDFVELFVAIYESKSVKASNDQKLSKKDFFQILMWFFNIRIGHWQGTLNAAKARKIEKGSPYLNELVRTFSEYAERGL